MKRGIILIVPAFEKNRGGGHLTRCVSLAGDLRALNREACLYLPADRAIPQIISFNEQWLLTEDDIKIKEIDLVILDRFQTTLEELNRWKEKAPVIGIDEGGSCRDGFDFLIDILPSLKSNKFTLPNIFNPALLKFPPKPQPKEKTGKLKILVTFGHEDSAGLGIKIANTLCGLDCGNWEITLLKGAFADNADYISFKDNPNIKLMDALPNLCQHLAEYDLVITHYGITAFEALYMGTPVILASPTKYHEKLAKNAGFTLWEEIIGKFSHKGTKGLKITKTLRNKNFILPPSCSLSLCVFVRNNCELIAVKYGLNKDGENLAVLIDSFSPQVNKNCPVCGEKAPEKSIARFTDRTYRRCKKCGIIYMDRITPPPFEYKSEYFNESYKKQYGKTYLEDFDNIKNMGFSRLKIIKPLLRKADNMTLLDIGCAYGPFLAAAKEAGFSPHGIDPSEDAVRYVQEKLTIPAIQGFFPDCPLPYGQMTFSENGDFIGPHAVPHLPVNTLTGSRAVVRHPSSLFSCISLWYVIEHFQNIETVLTAARNILAPFGILAFSTPNFKGISGRSSLKKFLANSPADHYTIWSPETAKKILAMAGFKIKKTVICGNHPQRFPFIGKYVNNKKGLLYNILLIIGKVFGLGDTFEIYAQKK